MRRFVYLPILILIVMFLGASLANMQGNRSAPDNNTTSSDKKSESIHAPVVTEQAQDRGQLLYENHCTACHADSVHNRNRDKAHSINEIRQWVMRWSKQLELGWGKHDVNVVTDFLNRRYYHFSTEK